MKSKQTGTNDVIESQEWLRRRINALLRGPEPLEALDYVTRLLAATRQTDTKLYCYRILGMLTFRAGNPGRARRAFRRAAELSPDSPGISYALAHCAAAQRAWWNGMRHAFEAVVRSADRHDEAEFIRVAALACQQLGKPDEALAMLLGALDRAPRNPWILESIGHFYESEHMWMEALGMRAQLIDVLADGIALESERTDDSPFYRVFQSFAIKYDISREAIEERQASITDRLRAQIAPADRREAGDEEAPLTPLNLPTGLATLVEQLAAYDRNYQLLETAQTLWARARHDGFDIELTPNTLAAAIQYVVERRHWRIPTPVPTLSQTYRVVPETIRAAARLVVGRFGVEFFALDSLSADITPEDWRRLRVLQKAILYGVAPDEVRPAMPMLGE